MKAAKEYQVRLKRFEDVVALRKPDRIPVITPCMHFTATKDVGISNAVAMANHEARYAALKEFVVKYDFDLAAMSGIYPSKYHDIIGAAYYQWPGKHLEEDLPFQFVEKEYMLADEYDYFLDNPNDYTMRVLWPRMAQVFEPLTKAPPLYRMGPLPLGLGTYMMQPSFREMAIKMVEFGEEIAEWYEADANYVEEVNNLGYPTVYGATSGTSPFDLVADHMRGLRGVMMDIYRQPGKLLAAIDLFTDMMLEKLVAEAKVRDNPRLPLWLHRGADSFMSDEHYKRFYWPSLRKLLLGLIDAGLTPLPYFQGNNTTRLKYMAELPKGKVPLHFDGVDRKKAREIIGGRQCFWGNVTPSLLVTGTPEQVREDVKELIDLFSDTGGLIIDGASFPDESRPENILAMIDATREFGIL
jgi:hypothetical protein